MSEEKEIFLNLNPYKIIRCLNPILEKKEIEKIRKALYSHVTQLLKLSRTHCSFAMNAKGPTSWRQRVSRGYYSAYCSSRAIRLAYSGHYSEDIHDHKLISDLPKDFPLETTWEEFLTKFKGDRNLADYDHLATEKKLELNSHEYVKKTYIFYRTTRKYLIDKGVIL